MFLTDNDWKKITNNVKRNIQKSFEKENLTFPVTIEEGVSLLRRIFEITTNDNELNDNRNLNSAIQKFYVKRNMDDFPNALLVFAVKYETFLNKIFNLTNIPIWIGQTSSLKGHILSFLMHLKHVKNDVDMNDVIDSTFNSNSSPFFASTNKVPDYPANHFITLLPIGKQLKNAFDYRNKESHKDVEKDDKKLHELLEDYLTVYLFIVMKVGDILKNRIITPSKQKNSNTWDVLKSHLNNFDYRQHYVLITDNILKNYENTKYLANVNWSFIIDLDINSANKGLFETLNQEGNYHKAILPIIHTTDDRNEIPSLPSNTTFYYFIKGFQGRIHSFPEQSSVRAWKSMYRRYTNSLIDAFSKISDQRPVNILILTEDEEAINLVLDAFNDIHYPINPIFALENFTNIQQTISNQEAKSVKITFQDLIIGFENIDTASFWNKDEDTMILPASSLINEGKRVTISRTKIADIEQYFEVLHLGKVLLEDNIKHDKTFYEGRTISWRELDSDKDVKRDLTDNIYKFIYEWLDERRDTTKTYLYHHPGAGGSTIARRIAYNIHKDFPVMLLNTDVNAYDEQKTIEKLVDIFQITDLPILVIIDNTSISDRQIHNLFKQAEARLTKIVFLITESRFEKPLTTENTFYLNFSFNDDKNSREKYRFIEKFERINPQINFRELINKNNKNFNESYLTPFYFSLIANEGELITIKQFIERRIENLSDKQLDLLYFLSFVTYYGNKEEGKNVDANIISRMLDINIDFPILQNIFDDSTGFFDLIIETQPLKWKCLHYLIAEALLRKKFNVNDKNQFDPYVLKDYCVESIDLMFDISEQRPYQVINLLEDLFIIRNRSTQTNDSGKEITSYSNVTIYDAKHFSKIITALKHNNLRIEVLEYLTSKFPTESSHSWGHLARIYSYNEQYENSIKAIGKAIEIDESDNLLHHIEGMCHRKELYKFMSKIGNYDYEKENDDEVIRLYDLAAEKFEDVRRVASKKEHGYIAHIDMISKILEYGYRTSEFDNKKKEYAEFITSNEGVLFRSLLDTASELINVYENMNLSGASSRFKETKTRLLKFYGSKQKVIDAWTILKFEDENYSNSSNINRQLVYAYLSKYNFEWDKVKRNELYRMKSYLEENLKNNPSKSDLRLWFNLNRKIGSYKDLLESLKRLEFHENENVLDIYFYLMALYAIDTLNGNILSLDKYQEYRTKCIEKAPSNRNRVFCPEWYGKEQEQPTLINIKSIGNWDKRTGFLETESLDSLIKMNGIISKHINPTEGFIEVENTGLQIFYQPKKAGHFSSDVNKTKVEFYLGFNYNGARAFEVRNI